MIICIETSTSICSVALCDRNGVVALKEDSSGKSHASLLTVFIEELLKENGVEADNLEAIAVSKGPGSYTGLRIGVSVAKGIAYGSGLPLVAVDTTLSMLHGFKETMGDKYLFTDADLFCPVIDARRMEVYTSVLRGDGTIIRETCAEIITEDSFPEIPATGRGFLFGNGAEKCVGTLTRNNIVIETGYLVSAKSIYREAYRKIGLQQYEDIAYFEPFYMKDFIATKPVKNILR
jgi:tRNA threonylcarbamoyladenosine biosynthesis protein TsaB